MAVNFKCGWRFRKACALGCSDSALCGDGSRKDLKGRGLRLVNGAWSEETSQLGWREGRREGRRARIQQGAGGASESEPFVNISWTMAAMAASFVPPLTELLAAEEKCRETHPVVVIDGRGSSSSGDSDFHSSSDSGKIGSLSAVVAVAAAPPNFGQCVCSWRSVRKASPSGLVRTYTERFVYPVNYILCVRLITSAWFVRSSKHRLHSLPCRSGKLFWALG